jgi:hypothetical protein
MFSPTIRDFFVAPTDTRSLDSIREKSKRLVQRDVRTAAERVAEKPPRWEEYTGFCYLIDGVCQLCSGQHPCHKSDCFVLKTAGTIYNVLSKCPNCYTPNKVHYPDCTDELYGGHGFFYEDFPYMNQDQLEAYKEHYIYKKQQLLRKKGRPGFIWEETHERHLDAIEKTLNLLKEQLEKRL